MAIPDLLEAGKTDDVGQQQIEQRRSIFGSLARMPSAPLIEVAS